MKLINRKRLLKNEIDENKLKKRNKSNIKLKSYFVLFKLDNKTPEFLKNMNVCGQSPYHPMFS